jgi:NADPH:quinone reductase-like Zn-dependent oxidoreductase
MKAIVQDRYGSPDVLELREIDTPVPKHHEVLVRVRAAAVHPGDWLLMRGRPYLMRLGTGLRGPRKRIPGFDVAGHVEAVGKGVTELQPGDEVFGEGKGSLAEYACAREDRLAAKPANLTFEQAAAAPVSALTALHALRDHGRVQPGQKVLINGASGGIGTFAVQIAKDLGADHVIDYTRDDFTRSGLQYDLILDNVANHSLSDCRRALTAKGMLIPNNGTSGGRWVGPLGRMGKAALLSPFVSQKLRSFLSTASTEDLLVLGGLIEAGKVTPVIDRTYPLSEAAEALGHVGAGHARGKVVISV